MQMRFSPSCTIQKFTLVQSSSETHPLACWSKGYARAGQLFILALVGACSCLGAEAGPRAESRLLLRSLGLAEPPQPLPRGRRLRGDRFLPCLPLFSFMEKPSADSGGAGEVPPSALRLLGVF